MTAVACLGDVNVDLIAHVDRLPSRGEEAFAEQTGLGLGGSAANTAVVLARLGLESRLLARVGDDHLAALAVDRLRDAGVDTGYLERAGGAATGISIVLVDPAGERTMVCLRGANRLLSESRRWDHGCRWLHVSGYALLDDPQRTSALAALERARAARIPVSVDVPSGVAAVMGPRLLEDLAGPAVLTVGADSLARLCPGDDPVRDALATGVGTLAVTAGNRALTLHRRGESVTLDPPTVDVVDTTGAGDSFSAGLVAAEIAGLGTGPTAVLAAALGAVATGQPGAGDMLAERDRLAAVFEPRLWGGTDPGWLRQARSVAGV